MFKVPCDTNCKICDGPNISDCSETIDGKYID